MEKPTAKDIHARLDHARDLVSAGRYDEATTEHVWLWEKMVAHGVSLRAHRLVVFARDLAQLVRLHAPARAAISELRDRAAPAASGPFDLMAFRDWECLNKVLGDESRILAWFEALPKERAAEIGLIVQLGVIPLLIAAGRWADAGALWDPTTTLERYRPLLEDGSERNDYRSHQDFRDTVVRLLRALSAAGRHAEVIEVERRARELDTSEYMTSALDATEVLRAIRRARAETIGMRSV